MTRMPNLGRMILSMTQRVMVTLRMTMMKRRRQQTADTRHRTTLIGKGVFDKMEARRVFRDDERKDDD